MARPAPWLLAALVLGTGTPALAANANPHAFMAQAERCLECHLRGPVPGGPLVKDIVSICQDCHAEAHRMGHPVDIRPPTGSGDGLPLDTDGTMTCVTCHDAHGPAESDRPYVAGGLLERLQSAFGLGRHRTFFLRLPNAEGQLCRLCHPRRGEEPPLAEHRVPDRRAYAGSTACSQCHGEVYRQWRRTPHARSLADPRQDPVAVAAVFQGVERFGPEDVVFSVGTHWTQRYVVRSPQGLAVAPGVWSLETGSWSRSYWKEQPWRELCSGCHFTGYDPFRETWVELGVGCEMCHGPGADHVRSRLPGDIIHPSRLTTERRESICASCHTNGHDRTGQFRFPVGYLPGKDLGLFFKGLVAKAGQGPDTFLGDGTLQDRLRSFRFWLRRQPMHRTAECRLCKGLHAGEVPLPHGESIDLEGYCLGCHRGLSGTGTYHAFGGTSKVDCYLCHRPLTDRQGRPSVHDHRSPPLLGKDG